MKRKVRFLVSAANPEWGAYRAKDETILDDKVAQGLIAGGLVEDLGEVKTKEPQAKTPEETEAEPETPEKPKRGKK